MRATYSETRPPQGSRVRVCLIGQATTLVRQKGILQIPSHPAPRFTRLQFRHLHHGLFGTNDTQAASRLYFTINCEALNWSTVNKTGCLSYSSLSLVARRPPPFIHLQHVFRRIQPSVVRGIHAHVSFEAEPKESCQGRQWSPPIKLWRGWIRRERARRPRDGRSRRR